MVDLGANQQRRLKSLFYENKLVSFFKYLIDNRVQVSNNTKNTFDDITDLIDNESEIDSLDDEDEDWNNYNDWDNIKLLKQLIDVEKNYIKVEDIETYKNIQIFDVSFILNCINNNYIKNNLVTYFKKINVTRLFFAHFIKIKYFPNHANLSDLEIIKSIMDDIYLSKKKLKLKLSVNEMDEICKLFNNEIYYNDDNRVNYVIKKVFDNGYLEKSQAFNTLSKYKIDITNLDKKLYYHNNNSHVTSLENYNVEKSIVNQLYNFNFNKTNYTKKPKINSLLDDTQKTIINKCLNNKISIITGEPGTGKCFTFDTDILMFDGTIKKVQDIKVKDKLMGDDSTPRTVLSLSKGYSPIMWRIKTNNESYVVTPNHILTLYHNNSIIDIPLYDYLKLTKEQQSEYKSCKIGIELLYIKTNIDPFLFGQSINCGGIPNEYKYNSKNVRLNLLYGLLSNPNFNKINIFDINYIRSSVLDLLVESFTVEEADGSLFYGFSVDKNHRFLLGNFIITHNSEIIKELYDDDTIVLAPTGCAVDNIRSRLQENQSTDKSYEVRTLHSFYNKYNIKDECSFCKKHNIKNCVKKECKELNVRNVENKTIIIDEFSMADLFIINKIMYLLVKSNKIILVGDSKQLPSISMGQLLLDLINVKIFDVHRLTKCYRSDKSISISIRHLIKNKRIGLIESRLTHIKLFNNDNLNIDLLKKMSDNNIYNYFLDKAIILAPLNNTVDELNTVIQSHNKNSIMNSNFKFKKNDKVIFLKNITNDTDKYNFYNGMTFLITEIISLDKIPSYDKKILIDVYKINENEIKNSDFDNYYVFKFIQKKKVSDSYLQLQLHPRSNSYLEKVFVCKQRDVYKYFKLVYASTIHKAQGKEFDVVILSLDIYPKFMWDVKLIYTAMSRAKKECHISGNESDIQLSCKVDIKKITSIPDLFTDMKVNNNHD